MLRQAWCVFWGGILVGLSAVALAGTTAADVSAMVATTKMPAQFIEGIDYKLLPTSQKQPETTSSNIASSSIASSSIEVVEFFNYGCPWCHRLEPSLEAWLQHKPTYVHFSRVPMVFEEGWLTLAKAYYVAVALKVENKMTPAIYHAMYDEQKELRDRVAIGALFARNGVSLQKFNNMYNATPLIDAQLNRGLQLAEQYQISSTPTITIGGLYYTDSALARSDFSRMMQIVDDRIKALCQRTPTACQTHS